MSWHSQGIKVPGQTERALEYRRKRANRRARKLATVQTLLAFNSFCSTCGGEMDAGTAVIAGDGLQCVRCRDATAGSGSSRDESEMSITEILRARRLASKRKGVQS